MKKIDWYIVKKFWGTFFYAIAILAVIACVIDYSEKVEDFVNKKVPTVEILNYFKNFVPHITALLFPLFLFIATIFFTSRLAYRSEIIAMLATGVSFQRFLRPYIIGAAVLCTGSLIANHTFIPNANKQRLAFEDKYIHYTPNISDRNVHLQLSKNLYVYMQSYEFVTNTGYNFTAETIDGQVMKEKISAERVSYDSVNLNWKLFNVRHRTFDGLKETMTIESELIKKYPFKPADLNEDDAIKEALTTAELNTYIAREKLRGRETLVFFYIEKYRRTSQPIAGLILTIIGVCIASRKIRGGSGLHLALGILISALYIMALQFTNTFATKAGLDPLVASSLPNILFGGLALYLYRKQVT